MLSHSFVKIRQTQEKKLKFFIDQKSYEEIASIGIEEGFLNDSLRYHSYDLLLKFQEKSSSPEIYTSQKKQELKTKIIEHDVNRSFNQNENLSNQSQ